jgi:hypothetical protein
MEERVSSSLQGVVVGRGTPGGLGICWWLFSIGRLRQLALNGGNGLAPISIEKPFVALFEAGADPEIPI